MQHELEGGTDKKKIIKEVKLGKIMAIIGIPT
jgi:hypothetical protein